MPPKVLFGRSEPWPAPSAVDDRIRGGKSVSHFKVWASNNVARFYGNLDITALGGAGFASQSFTFTPRLNLDPSRSSGLLLTFIPPTLPPITPRNTLSVLPPHEPHKFVVLLKNEEPARRPDGRRESVVVYEWVLDVRDYEAGFEGGEEAGEKAEEEKRGREREEVTVLARWSEFKAHYRGKEKEDAKPLDPSSIYELGFMCRSNFGEQAGNFALDIVSLAEAPREGQLARAKGWWASLLQLLGRWKVYVLELFGLGGTGAVRLP
ncbi:hypothetical protein JCM6882_004336 [Rhodosporidiobolus microsporus]